MTQAPSGSAALRTLFHDVRLLEFAWFAAGPIAGKWFADLGADVIRVESTTRPDGLRFAGARPPTADPTDPNSSSYYNDFNSSKRSIILEMNHPESTAVAQRLIEWSDVVTENFRPGVMKRWGLNYERLSRAHPDLIYVTLPAVGIEGPRWFYAGFGSGIKQIAGLTMLTGEDRRPPVGPPSAFPDFAINCGHGATAIIAALLHRQATGEGQFLEVAQMESTIVVTESAVLEATVNKQRPPRFANRDRVFCPHNVFPARDDDSWITIAVTTHAEWIALCHLIGQGDWPTDARFATLPARRRHAELLESGIAAWTSTRDAWEIERAMQDAGVPAAKVETNQELLELDEHIRSREYYWTLEHPVLGPTKYDSAPFRLSATPARAFRPAPLLGEHSFDIYQEAGFSSEEIADLVAKGIINI